MSIKQNKQPLANEWISHTCGFWRDGAVRMRERKQRRRSEGLAFPPLVGKGWLRSQGSAWPTPPQPGDSQVRGRRGLQPEGWLLNVHFYSDRV